MLTHLTNIDPCDAITFMVIMSLSNVIVVECSLVNGNVLNEVQIGLKLMTTTLMIDIEFSFLIIFHPRKLIFIITYF